MDSWRSVRKSEGFGSLLSVDRGASGFGDAVAWPWNTRGIERVHIVTLLLKGVHWESDLGSSLESSTTWLGIIH